jgi:hypothetical protein
MRLLQLRDVQVDSSDRVFRHPGVRALVIYLTAIGGVGCMFFYAFTRGWKIGYLFGGGVLLFLALMLRIVTARFRPSNWLVRMSETGLYVQYRSYLNYQLPADERSVVFISYGEIASARSVRERVKRPDLSEQGATQTNTLRYVELELSGDTTTLASALQTEQAEKAPMEKHWYGKSSTLYCDYPVTMATNPFLRIRWDVVPSEQKFLDALRPYARIVEPVVVAQDFVHLESLPPEEQKQHLRELAQRGDVITAIYIARRLYGCGLGEAKQMVEELRNPN